MATPSLGRLRCSVCDTDFAAADDLFEHDCAEDDGGVPVAAD